MDSSARLTEFLIGLSEVGRMFGFGISGESHIYILAQEDYLFDYSTDNSSRLQLGGVSGDSHCNSGTRTRRNTEGRLDADA